MIEKLTELNPIWLKSGGEGVFTQDEFFQLIPKPENPHAALEFDCPCGCKVRRVIPVENEFNRKWNIDNNTFDFETISLSPSIQVKSGCRTHFHIKNGKITP